MSHICVKATVSGRVQRVGFRFHTAHEGLKHSLTGYARNEADGSVTVLMCGEERNVEALLAWLVQGPPTANVIQLVHEHVDWQAIDGFSIQ
ncbi:acylphosphatase [Grimontia hollisae]|uniref:acylphosphatase n=1 Tax=Grimontia hollisae TaxID=673 RepID=A0A377HNW0_GRIHO|nr:acylphosphatase [Grimontia hollisae]AMG31593.1 acylphosphatase [Grimontia hollisae]MDF2185966.1 acylphosphatase [Grimontia hollisae]STO45277.1 Acylphosphatase [Grimontia hollisae]STO57816.1 Acylphosphatase [Grimontia hollisae]STQ76327.1 Acylphosphatase [Grimontia hollisae]